MDDLLRGRRTDYHRAARERLFGPPPDTATAADTDGGDAA